MERKLVRDSKEEAEKVENGQRVPSGARLLTRVQTSCVQRHKSYKWTLKW